MLHHFTRSIAHIALPDKFTYPFHYTPHPLCVMAADEVQVYLPVSYTHLTLPTTPYV